MSPLRIVVSVLAGVVGTLLLAEALLRLAPVPWFLGADADPAWPARTLAANRPYRSSSDWDFENPRQGMVNNAGYIAPFDYKPEASVGVVLGDSFVQGYMLSYDETLQGRLSQDLGLPASAVYNFGTAGLSLADYVGVARLIGERYRPQWAVIMVVAQDFVDGFEQQPGMFHWAAPPQLVSAVPVQHLGRLADLMRSSAIVRYARVNLKFTTAKLFASGRPTALARTACQAGVLAASDIALLEETVAQIPAALHLPAHRVVLVFDADRPAIYDNRAQRPSCPGRDWLARDTLRDLARAAGLGIVDTAALFADDWQAHHERFEVTPSDTHWSARAYALVARASAALLQTAEPAKN